MSVITLPVLPLRRDGRPAGHEDAREKAVEQFREWLHCHDGPLYYIGTADARDVLEDQVFAPYFKALEETK